MRLYKELVAVYQIRLSQHTIRNIVKKEQQQSYCGKQHKPNKKMGLVLFSIGIQPGPLR